MTLSLHVSTPAGAAHDIELSVAPASVSFASLDTAINVGAYSDEDTTGTFNPFAPAPSWSREVVKTPSRPGHSDGKRKLSVP